MKTMCLTLTMAILAAAGALAAETAIERIPVAGPQLRIVPLAVSLAEGFKAGDGASLTPLAAPISAALEAAGEIPGRPANLAVITVPGVGPEAAKAENPQTTIAAVQRVVTSMPDVKAGAGASYQGGQSLSDAMTGDKSVVSAGEEPAAPAAEASLPEQVAWAKGKLDSARQELSKVIIGHEEPIKEIVIAMTAGQHVLLEGLPGDGKTQTAKTIGDVFDGKVSRIQFTADLLPTDIVGVMIFDQKQGDFRFRPGPIFANIVLADEINRAPPKTHSALLEAMGEGQVTVDGKQMKLPRFTVLATQNPVEQDGTYKSPEAELDRFMFKSKFEQPSEDELIKIMRLKRFKDSPPKASRAATLEDLDNIRRISERVNMSEEVERYIAQIVRAAKVHDNIKDSVKYTVYTRAAQFLEQAARINAVMEGRDYVLPRDVQTMAYPVMRHRIALDYSAGEKETDQVIKKIIELVPVPKPAK